MEAVTRPLEPQCLLRPGIRSWAAAVGEGCDCSLVTGDHAGRAWASGRGAMARLVLRRQIGIKDCWDSSSMDAA